MKRSTKLIIAGALLIIAAELNAQQNCNVVCHNGSVLSGVSANAVDGHINHGDVFITEDCNYVETGTECENLSLPKFNINDDIPQHLLGTKYVLYDVSGKLIRIEVINNNFKNRIPKKGIYFLKVEGYQTLKLLIK